MRHSGCVSSGLRLSKSDPVARTLTEAIHAGDVEALEGLLDEHPV